VPVLANDQLQFAPAGPPLASHVFEIDSRSSATPVAPAAPATTHPMSVKHATVPIDSTAGTVRIGSSMEGSSDAEGLRLGIRHYEGVEVLRADDAAVHETDKFV
jgi:hypothetical protein